MILFCDTLALLKLCPRRRAVGIYLVLWFGHRPKADSQGFIPANAAELEERPTALLPIKDRVRLQVCVLDLSVTSPAARHGRKTKRRDLNGRGIQSAAAP